MKTIALEKLLRRILPQTMPCPTSMALDALQMICVDFFRESGAWLETFQEVAGPCDCVVEPLLPAYAVLDGVARVYVDGVKLESEQYTEDSAGIVLKNSACEPRQVIIKAALRPKRMATELPEELVEEYGDWLVFGTIAKLKAMSGNKVEWTDPDGAKLNYELYQEGIARAKQRRFRKKFGTSLLYVKNEDWE